MPSSRTLVPVLALVLVACDAPAEPRAPARGEPIVAPIVPPVKRPPPIAPALPPPPPATSDAWLAFASERWDFTAEFPAAPASEVISLPTAAGALEMHMFASELGGWAYMISVLDGPEGKPVAPGKVLDGARDGAVANIRGKLLAEKQLTHAGLPARRIEIVATPPEGEQRLVGLLVLHERRLYQALVVAPSPAKDLAAAADRFFATLRIAGK